MYKNWQIDIRKRYKLISICALFAVLSLLFPFLIIVPLHLVFMRMEKREFSIAFFALFLFYIISRFAGLYGSKYKIISSVLQMSFFISVYIVDIVLQNRKERFLIKIIVSVLIIGSITLFILLIPGNYELIKAEIRTNTYNIITEMSQTVDKESLSELEDFKKLLKPEELILKYYLFIYFICLVISFGIARFINKSVFEKREEKEEWLINFKIYDFFIWPGIFGLILILLERVIGNPIPGYFGYNITLIFFSLFWLQGFGIIKYILKKYNGSRWLKYLFLSSIIAILLIPNFNLIMIIGILILGISEIWIKHRTIERS